MSEILRSPSDRVNPEDYENAEEIHFDDVMVYKHFKEQQTDTAEIILETIQNAIDSTELDKPNKIDIILGQHPVRNQDTEPVLRVTDEGEGIARLHDFDIYKWIRALKAKSEKAIRERALGSKGIGMLQFPNIGDRIQITSMFRGMIVRVLMFENDRGMLSFGNVKMVPGATDEEKDFYGIHHDGTRFDFYYRDPNRSWIQGREISIFIKTVQEEYATRLAENEELQINVANRKVEKPQWIRDHPPQVLWINKEGHEVRGDIWADEKGTGVIKMYRGHKIMSTQPLMTQCSGYMENWDLKTSAPRTSFVDSQELRDTAMHLKHIVGRFPACGQQTDEKEFKQLHDYALKALRPPPAPTAFGKNKDLTKDESNGDKDGTDITGYPTPKEADPKRKIKRRKKHKRDNKNQVKAGQEGDDDIKKTSSSTKSTRSDNPALEEQKAKFGSEHPLITIFKDRVPWILAVNEDNDEYPLHQKLRKTNPSEYRGIYNNWIAEADAEADLKITREYRMYVSRRRVQHWREVGKYPNSKVQAMEVTELVKLPYATGQQEQESDT